MNLSREMLKQLEGDVLRGDPKAIRFVKEMRGSVNAARESNGMSIFEVDNNGNVTVQNSTLEE